MQHVHDNITLEYHGLSIVIPTEKGFQCELNQTAYSIVYFGCFSINTIKMLSKLYNTNQQQIYNLLLELKFCFQE